MALTVPKVGALQVGRQVRVVDKLESGWKEDDVDPESTGSLPNPKHVEAGVRRRRTAEHAEEKKVPPAVSGSMT